MGHWAARGCTCIAGTADIGMQGCPLSCRCWRRGGPLGPGPTAGGARGPYPLPAAPGRSPPSCTDPAWACHSRCTAAARQISASQHHEILCCCRSTSKAHATVLHDLIMPMHIIPSRVSNKTWTGHETGIGGTSVNVCKLDHLQVMLWDWVGMSACQLLANLKSLQLQQLVYSFWYMSAMNSGWTCRSGCSDAGDAESALVGQAPSDRGSPEQQQKAPMPKRAVGKLVAYSRSLWLKDTSTGFLPGGGPVLSYHASCTECKRCFHHCLFGLAER